jgi:hypothetical protein
MSGFNNDLSLTITDLEWANVLNMPTFFRGSYYDLTGKPRIEDLTGPHGPQGDPGPSVASEWSDIANKPTWAVSTQ